MAKFSLEIDSENAAFEGEDAFYEVARILREIAKHVENGSTHRKVYDVNGNPVGNFYLEVDEPEEEEDEEETFDEDEEDEDED